jgi:serine/threonine protein kinase/tetratricopeptide (TPR) repeat protein
MLTIGARLGPYEILAPLGSGGMGEVYRARDVRLGREVAVKVLPEHVATDPDRKARFEQEARAVAVLAHPNILVLHDFGAEAGVTFAVTELLEGETLRQRLGGGALPWRKTVEIGVALADGMAAAHAKGIIHRDLKPENIFLTADGRVKILDFGLARVAPPPIEIPGAETVSYHEPLAQTDPGTMMGTVGYMSPEQVRGLTVDARTDLFALGCVLYEMVAGRRAFAAQTGADALAAILNADPPDLEESGKKVPPEAELVIRHCLEKNPEQRFQSARDLAFALRALLSGSDAAAPQRDVPPQPEEPRRRRRKVRARKPVDSLAVLPLTGADAGMEYLSDGITDSLIQTLSQLPGLRVMARSTVFRYKGKDADAQQVGQALGVRAVLTGRLVQRGQRLTIETELVDVQDGSRLWGERYDRETADILAVEKAMAQEIAEKLRLRLTGEQRKRIGQPVTQSTEAYQCYLKGRYHWNKRTEDGLKKSIKLFEEAIEHDPTYALAYTGIADAYLNLGGWGHLAYHEAYPRAKAAATRALAIDENLAEAHVSLAMVNKEYYWDWAGAGQRYRRALELNPNYAVAHQWYGEYLAAVGRHTEAIAAVKRALDLDPLSLIIHATLGRHAYYFARQYDQAIAQLRKTLEMDANFWVAHSFLGWVYARVGRLADALAEFQTARRLDENLENIAGLGYTHGLSGHADEAGQALEELRQIAEKRYVSPILSAVIAIGLGQHDRAFDWLEKAYEDRAQMLSEIKADPLFDSIRSDQRFADLLRRVGLDAAG